MWLTASAHDSHSEEPRSPREPGQHGAPPPFGLNSLPISGSDVGRTNGQPQSAIPQPRRARSGVPSHSATHGQALPHCFRSRNEETTSHSRGQLVLVTTTNRGARSRRHRDGRTPEPDLSAPLKTKENV